MIRSFEPIADSRSRVLILGSIPGEQSLLKQQYYGHPRNQFWPLIYRLFGQKPPISYEERIAFVQQQRIALWDVVGSCEREGSLDINIRQPAANDFASFFAKFPNIRHVFFNGSAAEKLFHRLVMPTLDSISVTLYRLPSSSPAMTVPLETKFEHWKMIRDVHDAEH